LSSKLIISKKDITTNGERRNSTTEFS